MTDDPKTSVEAGGGRRRFWRSWRGWVTAALLVLLVALLGAGYLAKRTPSWYRPLDGRSDEVIKDADDFYATLLQSPTRLGHAARSPQTLTYSERSINALLAVRYLERQDRVTDPIVRFTPGHITLCARVRDLPVLGSGVITISAHVEVLGPDAGATDSATRIALELDAAWLGSLQLPMGMIRGHVEKALEGLAPVVDAEIRRIRTNKTAPAAVEEVRAWLRALGRGEAVALPHEFEVEHKDDRTGHRYQRKVHIYLQGITVSQGRIDVTLGPTPLEQAGAR